MEDDLSQPVALKRSLGLGLVVFYGLGNILGAGIYVLVGKVAGEAGMYAPLAFVVACGVAALTALSYAEMCARFPVSAGEAVYLEQGFGLRWLSMLAGLLISLAGLVSAATIVLGFSGYLQVFVALPEWLVALVLVLLLGAVTAWGITQAVLVTALLTVVEVAGLLLIIAVGGESLGQLPARWPELWPALRFDAWQGVMVGAFLAFYAFIGFEDMVNVAEEVKRPETTLPAGILIALGLATLLYLLVSTVAILTLEPKILSMSNAPLAMVYARATGEAPVLITLISLFAVVNGALIQMIMVSRILYGMSRQQWLPAVFGEVHPRTRTPLFSTAVVSVIVLVLAWWLPLVTLAKVTSFIVLLVFALVNLALWRLKRRDPHPAGVRRVPPWVPVAGAASALVLIAFELFF